MRRIRPLLWRAAGPLLAAAAVIVSLDTVCWLVACRRLEQGMHEAAAQAGATGWIVTTAPSVRAGWPFAAELRFPAVAVSTDPALVPDALGWSAESVRLRLSLFDPLHLHVLPDGKQSVRAGAFGPVDFAATKTDVAVALTGGKPPVLTVRGLDAAGWDVASLTATFPPETADVVLEGIAPPAQIRGSLPDVSVLRFAAALTRKVPPGPTPASRAKLWRDAGGTVEVTSVRLEWGPLTATGQITVRLDDALQPDGTGTLETVGLLPALDLLGKAGVLPAQTVAAARAVLAILGGSDAEKTLRLPVRVRRSRLEVAGFPLLRLRAIDWGPM